MRTECEQSGPLHWCDRPALMAENERLRAEVEALRADAGRYRWLCGNNFDKPGVRQIHTWLHTWEPHSQTGEPTEWTQRLRGSSLDAAIDAAIAKAEAGNG